MKKGIWKIAVRRLSRLQTAVFLFSFQFYSKLLAREKKHAATTNSNQTQINEKRLKSNQITFLIRINNAINACNWQLKCDWNKISRKKCFSTFEIDTNQSRSFRLLCCYLMLPTSMWFLDLNALCVFYNWKIQIIFRIESVRFLQKQKRQFRLNSTKPFFVAFGFKPISAN